MDSVLAKLTSRFSGRRVAITGAASGLGRSFCDLFNQAGWHIAAIDLNPIESLAAKHEQQIIQTFQVDVSDQTSLHNALQSFIHSMQGIDILINNAGIGLGESIHKIDPKKWHQLMNINFFGTAYGCQSVIPTMLSQRHGLIINIASSASVLPQIYGAAYGTSKAALIALGDCLSMEYKQMGIQVATAMPTYFNSNILNASSMTESQRKAANKMAEKCKYSSQDIALQTLLMSLKGYHQFFLPRSDLMTRMLYWFRLLFPNKALKSYAQLVQKAIDDAAT